MNVTVFGIGYVGCVTAACLAEQGHDVVGIDLDAGKVDQINKGKSPIVEPGLNELIERVVKEKRLSARTEPESLGDIVIVCVGTPSNENGSLGLGQVKRVISSIGVLLANTESYHVINIRSTVLPGTVDEIIVPLLEETSRKKVGKDFGVCMNPEFLRETTAISDFHNPPFTVIGAADEEAAQRVADLYNSLPGAIEKTTIRNAEMIKYACNIFHALKICFANEIGNLSKALGIDSHVVMSIFCKDVKLNLSAYYLKPGFAFGGSCLPKDLRAMLHKAKTLDVELPVISSALVSNRMQVDKAFDLICRTGKRNVALLGLSFKAGSDDLRESPIVALAELLIGKGYRLSIYDEEVSLSRLIGANRRFIDAAIPHIAVLLVASPEDAIKNSDVIVVAKKSEIIVDAVNRVAGDRTVVELVRLPSGLNPNHKSHEGICW